VLDVSEAMRRKDVVHDLLELGEVDRDVGQRFARRVVIAFRGQVDRHMDARERRPQLVRHVREQLPLGLQQTADPLAHLVERARHVAELIGALERSTRREIASGDTPRSACQHAERSHDPARREISARADHEGTREQRKQRAHAKRRRLIAEIRGFETRAMPRTRWATFTTRWRRHRHRCDQHREQGQHRQLREADREHARCERLRERLLHRSISAST
jgi:hypothetical protein